MKAETPREIKGSGLFCVHSALIAGDENTCRPHRAKRALLVTDHRNIRTGMLCHVLQAVDDCLTAPLHVGDG